MSERGASLMLAGPLDEATGQDLMRAASEQIGKADVVDLVVNCMGGFQFVAVAVYNHLRAMPYKVRTFNTGAVGSAALPVYLAGSERSASPVSRFFLHSSYAEISTPDARTRFSAVRLREELAIVEGCDETMIEILLQRGKFKGRQEVEDILFRGARKYSPEFALEHGLIHGIGELKQA